ncbi:MAG: hypothetical protein ACRDOK_11570 [Streptosporangiaceae bacterium]
MTGPVAPEAVGSDRVPGLQEAADVVVRRRKGTASSPRHDFGNARIQGWP